MTYSINGVEITLQPTLGRWLPDSPVGITGDGHPIIPSVKTFEMRWQLTSPSDFSVFHGYFSGTNAGGVVTVGLPEWGKSSYAFKNYSGCTLSEPTYGTYFAEHIQDVVIIINKIRV